MMKNREISRLEQIRKDKGLTRPQVAMLSGLTKDYLQKLELGKLSFSEMKLSTLLKLSKALRVKPSCLLPLELAKKLK